MRATWILSLILSGLLVEALSSASFPPGPTLSRRETTLLPHKLFRRVSDFQKKKKENKKARKASRMEERKTAQKSLKRLNPIYRQAAKEAASGGMDDAIMKMKSKHQRQMRLEDIKSFNYDKGLEKYRKYDLHPDEQTKDHFEEKLQKGREDSRRRVKETGLSYLDVNPGERGELVRAYGEAKKNGDTRRVKHLTELYKANDPPTAKSYQLIDRDPNNPRPKIQWQVKHKGTKKARVVGSSPIGDFEYAPMEDENGETLKKEDYLEKFKPQQDGGKLYQVPEHQKYKGPKKAPRKELLNETPTDAV